METLQVDWCIRRGYLPVSIVAHGVRKSLQQDLTIMKAVDEAMPDASDAR